MGAAEGAAPQAAANASLPAAAGPAAAEPAAAEPAAADAGQRELAHANRLAMLGRSVAMIVHDALQPVASTVTRGHSAMRWLQQDPPDVTAALASLERLVADAERAGRLLAELRALASPTGRPRESVSLNVLLRDTLRWLDDDLRRHALSVTLELPDADVAMLAERAALHQVFVNLVVNAIEAMADTAPAARLIGVQLSLDGPDAVVTVTDAGCGIDAAAAPRLFDAFHTTKPDGMGMGLAICQRIVNAHGGRISAEAQPAGGARFTVRLPVGPRPQAAC